MHIAFLSTEYPPLPSGGIGTSIRNLARALVGHGHKVSVIGWGERAEFEDCGVRVRFLPESKVPRMGWLLNRQAAASELNRLVREKDLEIVEAHDWGGPSAGMRLDCPLVVRCHGSAVYFAHLLKERVRATVRWAEWLALRQAADVAAVSRFAGRMTSQHFKLRKHVSTIPNGVDVTQFGPAQHNEIEPYTILYFGTLVRKKGVLDLCKAFSLVAEQNPQARLQLIGRDSPDKHTNSPSTWALCRRSFTPTALEPGTVSGERAL